MMRENVWNRKEINTRDYWSGTLPSRTCHVTCHKSHVAPITRIIPPFAHVTPPVRRVAPLSHISYSPCRSFNTRSVMHVTNVFLRSPDFNAHYVYVQTGTCEGFSENLLRSRRVITGFFIVLATCRAKDF